MSGEGPRIGILGGTFDPPHIGHLWLATLLGEAMGLDSVLFMPAGDPPHKPDRAVSGSDDRRALTQAAIDDNPRFELCPLELERGGPSYSIDSVRVLLDRHPPPARLYLLMAADTLAGIDAWREPDRLLELVEWVVGPRPGAPDGDAEALRHRFGPASERIHLVDGPGLDISSSEVRQRVASGGAIRYLVPRAVEAIIVDRGLYRGTAARSAHPG